MGLAVARHSPRPLDCGEEEMIFLGVFRQTSHQRGFRAVTFSVPCDLACSSRQLSLASNRIYMERFLVAMRSKIRAKKLMFPDQLDLTGLTRIRTFQEDDLRAIYFLLPGDPKEHAILLNGVEERKHDEEASPSEKPNGNSAVNGKQKNASR
jgi:hypothetical protein